MGESAEEKDIEPGTVLIDRYRVLRDLGYGGMSWVLCAEHVSLRTKVAIKLLLPELSALPDSPQRFEREALAATRVTSEHVARVLDVGTLPSPGPRAGTPYMVMEYLEGKDLGRLVREGKRFSPAEAIDLVVQAADALSRAHGAGVVHRDVKPSNLFLTARPDGTPLLKVLDFGISKVVEDAAQDNLELTKTTAVMGSAMYMSLEQMRSTKTVDRRTDIWSLGISLYEMLSGSHPWTAESFSELCVKVSLDPPVPLRKHRPDVPEALARVIERAYARKQEERYQSAGQFAQALSPFATTETRRRIASIRAYERKHLPGLLDPETPGWGRLRWAGAAVLAGALVAGGGAAAMRWKGVSRDGADAGAGDAAAADAAAEAGPEDAGLVDAAAEAGSGDTVDGGVVTAGADAGAKARDAGVRAKDPCAGKKGQTIVMPDGFRRVCL